MKELFLRKTRYLPQRFLAYYWHFVYGLLSNPHLTWHLHALFRIQHFNNFNFPFYARYVVNSFPLLNSSKFELSIILCVIFCLFELSQYTYEKENNDHVWFSIKITILTLLFILLGSYARKPPLWHRKL